ncbi:MAG: hypothetical protein U0X91_01995 [Spirosomataceae bacterium]
MDRRILTSRQYFKLLLLIYGVMLVGQVGTGAVFYFLRITQAAVMQDDAQLAGIFQYIVPAAVVLLPLSGLMLSKNALKNITEREPLSEKLRKYQSNLLLKYAFFEGPTLLALVAYFLTGKVAFLGAASALVIWFLFQIPHKDRVFNELPLLPSEASKLNDPEAEVAELPVRD